jgi:hypothetical protein
MLSGVRAARTPLSLGAARSDSPGATCRAAESAPMSRQLRSERTLTPEELQALGVLAAESAGLEITVTSWRDRLTKKPSKAGFGIQVTQLRDALLLALPSRAPDIEALCKRALSLMEQRNTAIHGKWAAGADGRTATNRRPPGTQVKAADLKRIATKISQCRSSLKQVLQALPRP